MIVIHKKLDAGRFKLPRATQPGEQHLLVSDAILPGSGSPRTAPAAPQSRALELGRGVASLFITDNGTAALITAPPAHR